MSEGTVFETLDAERHFALLRLDGPHALHEGIARIADGIVDAVAGGILGLVVDIRGIEGIAPPGMGARHEMMRTFATAADGRLRLAFVVRPEFIDPERFGVVAAGNFGLVANVFETQAEALYWLRCESMLDSRAMTHTDPPAAAV